jgi:hypothetical protein
MNGKSHDAPGLTNRNEASRRATVNQQKERIKAMTDTNDERAKRLKGSAESTRGGGPDKAKGAGEETNRGGGPDGAKGAEEVSKGGGPDKAKGAGEKPAKTAATCTSRKKTIGFPAIR